MVLLIILASDNADIQQSKALKMQLHCAQQPSATPTGIIPEASELGTTRYNGQNVGSQWCPL